MFFSTTDRGGKILSGNDVFVRVSGYERDQMVGQPHNLIRHPHMPRAIFKLVWDHLLAGRAVAGYVKNMACDGRHYWVVAYLMPVRGGFLSIRFKPSSTLQPVAEALYRQMLEVEQEQARAGADGKAAMAAADGVLTAALRGRGFDSYEAFMRTLLHEEMKCRDAAIGSGGLSLFPDALPAALVGDALDAGLRATYDHGRRVYEQINALYGQLDEFAALNEKIDQKSAIVLEQTADFRFIAFNSALRAARLGEEARSLGVIADHLGIASAATSRTVSGIAERINAITGGLRAVIFNLAAARLQIEMVLSFCAELATRRHSAQDETAIRSGMILDLQQAFSETAERAVRALLELEQQLGGLGATAEDLRKNVLTLQVAQVGGLVESSRLVGDDSFEVMFNDLRGRVERTKQELGELNEISDRLAKLAEHTPGIAEVMTAAASRMADEVQRLAQFAGSAPAAPAGEPARPARCEAASPRRADLPVPCRKRSGGI